MSRELTEKTDFTEKTRKKWHSQLCANAIYNSLRLSGLA